MQGAGRSPVTVVGSLSGVGSLTLEQGRFLRLDPQSFDATVRAVDQGLAIEPKKVGEFVGPALEAGALSVPHLNAALTVASGQARLINVVAHGEGADVGITGHLDLSDWTVDGQLTLTGPTTGSIPRPDIFVALHGPVADVRRTVDVSAFANWLLLRSLDREASRVEVPEPPTGATESTTPGAAPGPPAALPELREPIAHSALPLPEGRPLSANEGAQTHPHHPGNAPRAQDGMPSRTQRSSPPPPHRSLFEQLFGTQR